MNNASISKICIGKICISIIGISNMSNISISKNSRETWNGFTLYDERL